MIFIYKRFMKKIIVTEEQIKKVIDKLVEEESQKKVTKPATKKK